MNRKLNLIRQQIRSGLICTALLCIGPAGAVEAKELNDDWPQWRGPNRDGISKETGILKSWPENGPTVLWRNQIGEGYSAMAVANDKLFTMWTVGKKEVLFCLNEATGEEIWRHEIGSYFFNDQGGGPRACPTVDGNLVYAAGARGNLKAVDVNSGKLVWERDLVSEYGARIPRWGYSSSPLVEGNMLMIENGGKSDHAYLAFNKKNGELVWHSHTDKPGYSSPLAITVNDQRQIVFFSASGLSGVTADKGRLLWEYPWTTSYDANIAIPIFMPPNKIFISTNYGVGAAMVEIVEENGGFEARTAWKTRIMKNHFNSSILHDDHLYGFDNGILKCIEAETGEEKWKTRGFQKGSLVFVDGHLIILGERGKLALAVADPNEYREVSAVQALTGKCWTMPTVSDGKLYLRNQREMICIDISGGS